MQTVVLVLGVVFTTLSFFATADEHANYYLPEDNNIGTRREGEYYDAYPVPAYTGELSTVDEKQSIDEFQLMSAVPGIFALLGVIAIAWAQANDHNNQQKTIDDQKSKQTNICTSLRASPNTLLTRTVAATNLPVINARVAGEATEITARLNLIEDQLIAMRNQNSVTSCT